MENNGIKAIQDSPENMLENVIQKDARYGCDERLENGSHKKQFKCVCEWVQLDGEHDDVENKNSIKKTELV